MTLLKSKPATYADIEALPLSVKQSQPNVALEREAFFIERAIASSNLGMILGPHFVFGSSGHDGWIILHSPKITFGAQTVDPSLAGWKSERLIAGVNSPVLNGVPDWICETYASEYYAEIGRYRRWLYHQHAVPYYWMLNVESHLIETFAHKSDGWLLTGCAAANEDVSAPPFDAITFPLGQLWPFDPPADDHSQTGA